MNVKIKTSNEIKLMREAGRIVGLCHYKIKEQFKPGITTMEINNLVEKIITENNGTPSFKNYQGFPYSICASINDTIVHGFPNNEKLKNGDIVTIDIGVNYKGYHGDSAWTYTIGEVNHDNQKLLEGCQLALKNGLAIIKPGIKLNDISKIIEETANKYQLSVVPEYTGHGIGNELHEDPFIPNFNMPTNHLILKEGMTLAIEPILNFGTSDSYVLDDGWTVKTADKKNCAHFEHTIVVTKLGYEILTNNIFEGENV